MVEKSPIQIVRDIMTEFAVLTGLDPPRELPRRYLWTDAFAVCNFLELWQRTGMDKYKSLALKLVDQVHHVLGRHREDAPRRGWISGLDENDGRQHPTKGGLRIGKKLNERGLDEPFDEQLEWERDGQYFHYLTKWMHALNRVSTVTGDLTFNRWAIELAKAANSFVYVPPHSGQKRMYWKMSINLSRPLVPSMGHHDPLDGFITFSQLQAAARKFPKQHDRIYLAPEIADMATMCEGREWVTDDALGIGGLLGDSYKVWQLISLGDFEQGALLSVLLDTSLASLKAFTRLRTLRYPADYRLAFRELGLSIGLHAVERLQRMYEEQKGVLHGKEEISKIIDQIMGFAPVAEEIEAFWLNDSHQRSEPWVEHRDINMVMLATSLSPDTYLTI